MDCIADSRSRSVAMYDFRIAPKAAIRDDGRETIHVANVVDFGLLGRPHGLQAPGLAWSRAIQRNSRPANYPGFPDS